MRRILLAYPEVSPLYVNGGIGTYVCEVAHLLAEAGWDVDVLTDFAYPPAGMRPDFSKSIKSFAKAGIRLLDLDQVDKDTVRWDPPDLLRSERYFRTIARLHETARYDVIEFPDWRGPGFLAVRHHRLAGALAGARLVVHLHSSTKDVADWHDGVFTQRAELITHYMEQYVKAHADVVLSPSEYLLAPLRSAGLSRPMFRSGYPIMTGHAPQPRERDSSSAGSNVITVACISRLERRKGQDVLAQALGSLAGAGALGSDVRWVFCGNDSMGLPGDRSMAASLRRLLSGVPNWTILNAKPRPELLAWLATDVNLCVVPSRGDNYPNVILEAAGVGCQVVCSDAGGIPEVIRDYGIPAAVYPSEDHEALARALAVALDELRCEGTQRERRRAEFEQACRRQRARTVETYESIAALASPEARAATWRQPPVSLLLAAEGDDHLTAETLGVLCEMDYPHVELLLALPPQANRLSMDMADGSTGKGPPFQIVRAERPGLAAAWNAALQRAKGEFVVPLDKDIRLDRRFLGRCVSALDARPELTYVTTYGRSDGEAHGASVTGELPEPLGAVEPLLLLENTLGAGTAMLRREHLVAMGGFPEHLVTRPLWDLWLTCLRQGRQGDVIPEPLQALSATPADGARPMERTEADGIAHAVLHAYESLLKDHAVTLSALLMREAKGAADPVMGNLFRSALFGVTLCARYPGWALRYAGQRLSRAIGIPTTSTPVGHRREAA